MQHKLIAIVLTSLIYFTVLSSIFAVGGYFCDYMMALRRYTTIGGVLISVAVILFISFFKNEFSELQGVFHTVSWAIIVSCTIESVYMFGQVAGVFGQLSEFGIGTFDNTAGFSSCICFGIPFFLKELTCNKKWNLYLSFLLVLCLGAVLYSASRTSLISLCVICVWSFSQLKKFSYSSTECVLELRKKYYFKKWKSRYTKLSVMVIIVLIVSFFCLLMYLKRSSTDGRIFVLQIAWEMIQEKPWLGYGFGGFASQYMYKQAEFFRMHPYDVHALLADNVHHPLNEFVLVLVDFGVLGLLVCLLVIVGVYVYGINHRNRESCFGMELLTLIFIFSMFSYPFFYPFTWLILLIALICIFRKCDVFNYLLRITVIAVPVVACIFCVSIVDAMRYRKAIAYSEDLKYGLALQMYQKLYDRYRGDGAFLYNYACCLLNATKYEEAKNIAEEASEYLADYNLCMLKGYIYENTQDYSKSLREYELAHNMCPSRILPIYEQFRLYRICGNIVAINKIRESVSIMPCKKESAAFRDMWQEIMNYK